MKASLLFLSAMELLKLQFIASFCFLALGMPFPFLPASILFFLALVLSRFLRRRGMRVFFFFLLELVAFAICFVAVYSVFKGGDFDLATLLPRNDAEALSFFAVLASLALFWIRAAWLETRKADHEFCAARFDEGLALFLMGLSIAALVKVENPLIGGLALPYFLFAILALGSSKNEGAHRGGIAKASRGTMVAWAAIVFALAGIGVVALVPALTEPARQAAGALKGASLSLLKMLGAILEWLFRARRPTFADKSSPLSAPPPPPPPEGKESQFSAILMWIVLAIAGAFILFLLGYLLLQLFRLLTGRVKKPVDEAGRADPWQWLKALFDALARIFSRLAAFARRKRGRRSVAIETYGRLLAGGRAGGAARRPNETPREYARRLAAAFPDTAGAAGRAAFIAEALENEVYGGAAPDAATTARLSKLGARLGRGAFVAERLRSALGRRNPKR